MAAPGYWYTHPFFGLTYVGPQATTDNTSDPVFIEGYFHDRIKAGDRVDPATGKVFNVNDKE